MLAYLEEIQGRSALTAKRYHAYLDTFTSWLSTVRHVAPAALTIAGLDAETLRQFRLYLARRRDSRTGTPLGAGTRNLYLVALRNLLRYCRRRGIAVPDPEQHLAKERDIEVRHLTREEALRMLEAIRLDEPHGLRDRALVEALFGTAVRVSELCTLQRRRVDLQRREVEVIGKGGKSRLVLLTAESAYWLKRYLDSRTDDSVWLFLSPHRDQSGQPRALSIRSVQRTVDEAAHRAGLPFRVSPHWLRHTRLTVLARHAGVQVAQRIAGHSSLATTSRYLHVTDQHLRQLFDAAEEKDARRD